MYFIFLIIIVVDDKYVLIMKSCVKLKILGKASLEMYPCLEPFWDLRLSSEVLLNIKKLFKKESASMRLLVVHSWNYIQVSVPFRMTNISVYAPNSICTLITSEVHLNLNFVLSFIIYPMTTVVMPETWVRQWPWQGFPTHHSTKLAAATEQSIAILTSLSFGQAKIAVSYCMQYCKHNRAAEISVFLFVFFVSVFVFCYPWSFPSLQIWFTELWHILRNCFTSVRGRVKGMADEEVWIWLFIMVMYCCLGFCFSFPYGVAAAVCTTG